MKPTKYIILSVILMSIIALRAKAVSAFDICATTQEGHKLYYRYTYHNGQKELSVCHTINMDSKYYRGHLTIPESVNGLKVTSIASKAFDGLRLLTSVTIPNSITSIDDAAFAGCSSLESITIPESVTSIGNYVFGGCSGLTEPIFHSVYFVYMPSFYSGAYTIPEGITKICGGAFEYCDDLSSVIIPNGVTTIGEQAFYKCGNLTSVTIPNSVISIDKYAFCGCGRLTSVTIPNSVTSIGEYAFKICSDLTSVTIPNSVTSIGKGAFEGCSNLTSVISTNPKPATIDANTFKNISNKCKLFIPYGATSTYNSRGWKEQVFKGGIFVHQLVITFPADFEVLELGANSTLQLKPDITFLDIKRYQLTWTSSNDAIATVSNDGFVIGKQYGTATITCSYRDPNGEMVSASCAIIVRNRIVSSIKFVDSTQVLENGKQTTLQLKPIVVPEDVSYENLVWMSSDESIATVSNTGFVTAKKSGVVTITCKGETMTDEWVSATCQVIVKAPMVYNISFMSPIEILEYETSVNNTIQLNPNISPSDVNKSMLTWMSSDKDIATVSSDGVVTGKNYGTTTITCSGINTEGKTISASCRVVVYKKGLFYVGNIFYDLKASEAYVTNCAGGQPSELTKERGEYSGTVNIPEKVTYDGITYPVTAVGDYAFYNQKDLQAVVIPKSVLTLNSRSFEKAKNLSRVAFMSRDEALKSVGERAFYECEKLNDFVLPNSTLRIDHAAFRYCKSLSNITLSNSLNYINEYAFADCPVLNNVILPESLKSIQIATFNNDVALSNITFPADLEGIGASAFANCTNLRDVTFNTNHYNMTIGEDAFKGSNAITKVKVANLDSWVSINFSNPEANPASISHSLYDNNNKEIVDAIVPNGPIYVNNNVFYGCQQLKSVELPASIQFINDNIFYGCTSLKRVASQATTAPIFIGTDDPSKMNSVFKAADLYVTKDAVTSYQSNDWWKRFGTVKVYTISDDIADVIADEGEYQVFTSDGRSVSTLQKGMNIIRMKDGKTKKMLVK